MNAEQLKEYIKEDIERLERVLEASGCHRIWRTGKEIRCAPPWGDNHTSVSVNIETLFCKMYTVGETWSGDIIGLVQALRKEKFKESYTFLKSLFGLGGKFVKDTKVDPLSSFKGIRKRHRVVSNLSDIDIKKFGKGRLDEFVMLPHISLFHEGIMPSTAKFFNVGYDQKQSRVIFPHYNYDSMEDIVGITGRSTFSAEEIKEFKIPKYFNYIKHYKKMYNLYGFSHSLEFVAENKMLVIHEAEKSTLKHFTQTRNKGFSASTGGHELSDIQVQIILHYTPSDTEIVIAYDKDVMMMKDDDGKSIGEEFLVNTCNKISRYRKTSYIWDKYDILNEREAPIDRGKKIFDYLMKHRKVI